MRRGRWWGIDPVFLFGFLFIFHKSYFYNEREGCCLDRFEKCVFSASKGVISFWLNDIFVTGISEEERRKKNKTGCLEFRRGFVLLGVLISVFSFRCSSCFCYEGSTATIAFVPSFFLPSFYLPPSLFIAKLNLPIFFPQISTQRIQPRKDHHHHQQQHRPPRCHSARSTHVLYDPSSPALSPSPLSPRWIDYVSGQC